jgi:hypothetical protein
LEDPSGGRGSVPTRGSFTICIAMIVFLIFKKTGEQLWERRGKDKRDQIYLRRFGASGHLYEIE